MVVTGRVTTHGYTYAGDLYPRVATRGYSFPPTAPTIGFKRLVDTSLRVDLLETSLAVRLLDTTTAVTFEETG